MEDEPATEILDATHRALCQHGYADLTLQDIAVNADKSKSSMDYHYDYKEYLFVAFLYLLYERYPGHSGSVTGQTPHEQLYSTPDILLTDSSQQEFLTTITGAHTRQVAVDQSPERFYATMTRDAETQLLADEQTEVAR